MTSTCTLPDITISDEVVKITVIEHGNTAKIVVYDFGEKHREYQYLMVKKIPIGDKWIVLNMKYIDSHKASKMINA